MSLFGKCTSSPNGKHDTIRIDTYMLGKKKFEVLLCEWCLQEEVKEVK